MKTTLKMIALLVVTLVTLGSSPNALAEVIVFDDTFQNGFTKRWDVNLIDSATLPPQEGSFSLRRSTGTSGNGVLIETGGNGFTYGNTPILSFYVNSTSTGQIGFNMLSLRLSDNSSVEMGTRGDGVTWVVDGVETKGPVVWTNDPNVWTHVTFDLSQTYWFYDSGINGNAPANIASDTLINTFEVRYNGPPSGQYAPYLDNISLQQIPEPGSLVLLAMGAGCLIVRHRKNR